ncbi:PadR family transcriptional regulator [Alicyclobacillus acidiphilus]|uniref:PadR family transcriptional regulator n=1 Tax=Alicyclobacillus acidiphilus TaxID=182455 RepID=UPI00082E5177|nr:helix-turn-helix transcriptional regulator [Alicyclobacillus acidiphilus]
MYELIVLGFLMQTVTHGYRISKIINDMIGPYAKFSSGRLYPLFDKLERDGFVEAVDDDSDPGGHRHRAFRITETGRQRFYRLMLDTTSNLGDYRRLFGFKYVFFDLLPVDEQIYLIEHYIHYCQTHLYHIESEIEDLRARAERIDSDLTNPISMMEHTKKIWEMDIDWATRMRDRIVTRSDT